MTERTAGKRGGGHPDGESLRAFAHGRLDKATMAEVERHVGGCDACCRAVEAVPDDRLVGLLLRRQAVLLILSPVLALAAPGCSGEPVPLRAKDREKAREAMLKKSEIPGRPPGLPAPKRRQTR